MEGDNLRDVVRRRVASSRVFVLGAGFSAAAGVPMIGSLLSLTMKKFERESPGLYSRVKSYVRTCFSLGTAEPNYAELDFAELCTFLEYVELSKYGEGSDGQAEAHAKTWPSNFT